MNRGFEAESRERFPFSYFLFNVVARDGRRSESAGTQQAERRTSRENVAPKRCPFFVRDERFRKKNRGV